MDLKKMQTFIWLILFGVLIFVSGSTLNAIESIAVTAMTAEVNKPIPTVAATTTSTATTRALNSLSAVRRNILRRNTISQDISATAVLAPLNSYKTSMTSAAHSFGTTTAEEVAIRTEIKAKSSITTSTKNRREAAKMAKVPTAVDDYKFSGEFSTTQNTKTTARISETEFAEAKVSTLAATEAFSESSTQSTTKVNVTTKRTKASLRGTVTADKKDGRRVAGEWNEKNGSQVNSMVTKSTTAITPMAIATARGDMTSTSTEATTIESLAAVAAAQLVATLLPITAINDAISENNYQNTAYSKQKADNNSYSYNYNYGRNIEQLESQEDDNNNNSGLVSDMKHITGSYQQRRQPQQQQTHPLRRPEIQKSEDESNNNSNSNNNQNESNNFFYNSNNNYFNSQQNAPGSMLVMHQQQSMRQQRQQYPRQLQQQQYYLATIPAIVVPAIDNNLIANDIFTKQNSMNSNKSMPMKSKKNQQLGAVESAPTADTVALTTVATKLGTRIQASEVAVVALGENETMNTSTPTLPFPTISITTMKSTTRRPPPTTTPRPTPSIDDYQTVISQAGTHAYLPCNVKQLVKKPISWLRVRDGHILTVDQTTFIADQRFQSIFAPNPERWSLQIKYVQLKDEGTYECQVSTEPKSSAIVTLRIVEPKTELIGEPTRHVKAGSQVKLRCIISQALEPPVFINWFHNQKQIYLHSRRGWRTEIERIELPITDTPTTASTTTTTTSTTKTPSTSATSPTATFQVEGATTNTVPINATLVATSTATTTTTTIISEGNDFDNDSDMVNAGTDASTLQATGAGTSNGVDIALMATTMSLTSAPPSPSATTDSETSTIGVGNSYAFASGNATSSMLGAIAAAAAVTMSTALPTITKTMDWPKTTTTITTASTTLSAVEVRQITTASLIIASVEKQDSGNYTCSPSNSAPKTVVLHVLNGEYSASAITSGVGGNAMNCDWISALLLLLLQYWHYKFIANLGSLRIVTSTLVLFIWPQAERCNHTKTAKAIVALRNFAAPITEASSLCGEKDESRVFQQKQLDSNYNHDNNHNKGVIGTVDKIARQADNDRNSGDGILNIRWRTGSTLNVQATKDKT